MKNLIIVLGFMVAMTSCKKEKHICDKSSIATSSVASQIEGLYVGSGIILVPPNNIAINEIRLTRVNDNVVQVSSPSAIFSSYNTSTLSIVTNVISDGNLNVTNGTDLHLYKYWAGTTYSLSFQGTKI